MTPTDLKDIERGGWAYGMDEDKRTRVLAEVRDHAQTTEGDAARPKEAASTAWTRQAGVND